IKLTNFNNNHDVIIMPSHITNFISGNGMSENGTTIYFTSGKYCHVKESLSQVKTKIKNYLKLNKKTIKKTNYDYKELSG
ncbi:MAG: hypothetical protein ACOC2W_02260, partial [bacterium]